ncbi:MAG TPA: cytidylate kinase-like family protein [Gemmatimonadaceae bacterium]|nr:cytidylate kinase-like family protein [Gemmatimonadaceae bacterium]
MHSIDLITLSREFGAGASELAAALGARLGWPVLDREIAPMVARRLGLPPEVVEDRDERAPGFLQSIGDALIFASPDLFVGPDTVGAPSPADIAAATRQILLQAAAERRPLITVGHGGQALFHGRPGALHVRLVAPLESRLRRICGRRDCAEREAAGLAKRIDAGRVQFVRDYFGRDVRDPLLYHLVLNTGMLGMDECLTMVEALVRGRG